MFELDVSFVQLEKYFCRGVRVSRYIDIKLYKCFSMILIACHVTALNSLAEGFQLKIFRLVCY